MLGHHAFYSKVAKIPFAAGVHGMHIGNLLLFQPGIYLRVADHFRARARGYAHQVGDMDA